MWMAILKTLKFQWKILRKMQKKRQPTENQNNTKIEV